MKNKIIFSFMIFILLVFSIVFVNSYVQALTKQEELEIKNKILEQEVRNDKVVEEETNQIYQNSEQRVLNCNIDCEYNENCPVYQQHKQCYPNNNCERNYRRNHHGCNR